MRAVRDKQRGALWPGVVASVLLLAAPTASRADSVMLWNNTLLDAIQHTSGLLTDGPPEIAREIAMVDGAMYDAVNAADGDKYKPYAYTGGPAVNANADAAALQAGYAVMTSIFTGSQWLGAVPASVLTDITNTYNTALAALGPQKSVTNGLALGTAAANAMITLRANDGSAAAIANGLNPYVPPGSGTVPGVYVPPATRPAMFPTWGTVTPFTMTSSMQFAVPPPPDITSPGYAASILETECLGPAGGSSSLPAGVQSACAAAKIATGNFGLPPTAGFDLSTWAKATNSTLALFWNDPGGTTVTPPGHWLSIADTVLTTQHVTDELQQARLSAMLGTAEADAAISAWQAKYTYNLWRPVTAINDCASWNAAFTTCDPGWTSLIATPPHPDYLAGHPDFSGAAATVLDSFFGTDYVPFCSTSDQYVNAGVTIAPITLCYRSFMAAAQDATDSRIYGGIHTSYAVNNSLILGKEIGANVVANFFTPTSGGHGCGQGGGWGFFAFYPIPTPFNQGCGGYGAVGAGFLTNDAAPIPEPGSFGLLGLAIVALRTLRRRQRQTGARHGAI